MSEPECPICLENIDLVSLEDIDSVVETQCNHLFCKICLQEWQGREIKPHLCPMCRTEIGSISISYRLLDSKSTSGESSEGSSSNETSYGTPSESEESDIEQSDCGRRLIRFFITICC
jgi:hypothetical protein